MQGSFFRVFLGIGFLGMSACTQRPVDSLIFADVALRAAQKAKADVLAPDAYRKAENYFLRAKRDFNEGYFDSCRKYGEKARILAEQAEYKAMVRQTQTKPSPSSEEAPPQGESFYPERDKGGPEP